MYLLKKFRKSQAISSRKSRKISVQFKRISKRMKGSCCIERRESIYCGETKGEKFYKSHQIVLL